VTALRPQEAVERALSTSKSDGCIAIVTSDASTNLRWANNTLTTNGVTQTLDVTVVATVKAADGTKAASISRNVTSAEEVAALVADADAAAHTSAVADDAAPLLDGASSPDWDDAPVDAPVGALSGIASWLGEIFATARAAGQGRYGYAEHSIDTVYLGTSTGTRLRFAQPAMRLELTGRTADGSSSAWSGRGSANVDGLDLAGVEAEVAQRLEWAQRKVSLEAGRYETVLPPSAVADMMINAYWSLGALDADEGQSVYSRAGGGTRVGERLTDLALTLRSDPSMPGQECLPFAVAGASSRMSSVFDNGAPLSATDWIRAGELVSLIQTRYSAGRTGLAFTPWVDNLELVAPGGEGSVTDLVASTQRGLLLTCLWYIREVDPQTLLLTGLTRDGVYLIEDGEVVGAVNNFRFNESPVGMLKRIVQVGRSGETLAREFGDYFTRTRMPALRVADFNMSTVSQAS
jgi:predicted Zn-dependent protease